MNGLLELQSDPVAFRAALMIDTDAGPAPLAERIDPWQDRDFRALDSGWKRAVIGTSAEAKFQRAWLERPRGHSKSSDLAVMTAWALFASVRRLSLVACAADQDQARLLRDAIGRLLHVNPWLAQILEVQAYRVVNARTGSVLEIISSDAKSSYGLTPDGIICDEVVHWRNRDLWDSMLSSAAKRSTCMLVVITNAGLQDDWCWKTRSAVRVDPSWYFSRLEGPVASWISKDLLAEQERLLPSIAFRRLWLNEWTTGGGDALSEETIKAAFFPDLRPQTSAAPGFEYVGGLDLGVSRDASAVCILGVRRGREGHGIIRLAFTRVWRPTAGRRVDLQEVEDTMRDLHRRFDLQALNFDPWEARHLASRLQAGGLSVQKKQLGRLHATSKVPMVEVTSTPKNLQQIATVMIEAFNDRRLELFEDADLRRDLTRLRVEERQYGFRLTSPRDEHGHGDLGSAFGYGMLAASELAAKRKMVITVGFAGDGFSSRTPLERALARASRESERFDREQEQWRRGDDHDAEFREAMRQTPRINPLF